MRSARRAAFGICLAATLLAAGPAAAQEAPRPKPVEPPRVERWAPPPGCAGEKDKAAPRGYFQCLYDTARVAEQAMQAAFAEAMTAIDARADLAPVQRARWKSLLDEAQSRFLLFRNFDCQSVAPFEGRRGIGNFEQRSLCLIDSNLGRAAELKARYPAALPGTGPTAVDGPQRRPGIWIFLTPPPVD